MQQLPIGIQNFPEIRERGYAYADKTDMVWHLAHRPKYHFLSRPRRFGKSLLLSTLECYFRGREDLFRGLKLEALQRESGEEWVEHPVVKLSMAGCDGREADEIALLLEEQFDDLDEAYDVDTSKYKRPNIRFARMLKVLHRKYKRRVVVLVDEYDVPLLQTLSPEKRELHEVYREILRSVYMNLKDNDEYIHFGMLTGVSQFSQLTLFSGLNNIRNISLDDGWSTVCGFTEEDIVALFPDHLEALAGQLGCSRDEALERLRNLYDGYCFTPHGQHIYNPFGLMQALDSKYLDCYWMKTGTPSVLQHLLSQQVLDARKLEEGVVVKRHEISTQPVTDGTPIAMLYQTGYLTIKKAIDDSTFLVAFPNREIRTTLAWMMGSKLLGWKEGVRFKLMERLRGFLDAGDIKGFMGAVDPILAGVPYMDAEEGNPIRESNFRNAMYVVLTMLEEPVQVERPSAMGRSDCEVEAAGAIYIFEMKLKRPKGQGSNTPLSALQQIKRKRYGRRLEGVEKPVICVGAVFDGHGGVEFEEMGYEEVMALEVGEE
ncbi:MAG: hypothetical protein CSA97_05405 [Bacteroidetes bacterium]|nr:MAG: hypothetical protein CSA97_05405 [Bacteroidota bacterium]